KSRTHRLLKARCNRQWVVMSPSMQLGYDNPLWPHETVKLLQNRDRRLKRNDTLQKSERDDEIEGRILERQTIGRSDNNVAFAICLFSDFGAGNAKHLGRYLRAMYLHISRL